MFQIEVTIAQSQTVHTSTPEFVKRPHSTGDYWSHCFNQEGVQCELFCLIFRSWSLEGWHGSSQHEVTYICILFEPPKLCHAQYIYRAAPKTKNSWLFDFMKLLLHWLNYKKLRNRWNKFILSWFPNHRLYGCGWLSRVLRLRCRGRFLEFGISHTS